MENSNFVKGLEDVIERAAAAVGISLEHGNAIIHHYFKSLRKFLDDPRIPTISVPFGDFKFSTRKMKQSLAKRAYHESKGQANEEMNKIKDQIWGLILEREQKEAEGIPTTYWYNKTNTLKINRLRRKLQMLNADRVKQSVNESRRKRTKKSKEEGEDVSPNVADNNTGE